MKRIAFFCIPAYGHTNPMLPVASELVKRENIVRFYSFDEFEERIKATGAEFVSCDRFLIELTKQEESRLKEVNTTEMTIQDIRITMNMNSFLEEEFRSFCPDVIYTDSVCFWGKLSAWKYNIPMVVSTSTFAFNKESSGYMKSSAKEVARLIFGLPKIGRELKRLRPYGYPDKKAFELIQNDNETDTVVYTSRRFQPCADTFDTEHYAFVGPSINYTDIPNKEKERPLVYISLGTVINDKPLFYKNCVEGLKALDVDVIISCGKAINPDELGDLPHNIKILSYVNQLEVLRSSDAFITHCGMNSVSESLYMATPMALYPQTNEQRAVARRTVEIGAGRLLEDDSAEGIREAVKNLLENSEFAKAAQICSEDFRSCSGPRGAAEFIENAPHANTSMVE